MAKENKKVPGCSQGRVETLERFYSDYIKLERYMTQENLISQKLRVLLAQNRIRASHVCGDTGIAQSTMSRLINGKSKGIEFETIEKICKYFGIEPRDLFTPIKKRGI